MKKNGSEKGSLMIESLVAMTLVVVGLLGIFGLIAKSLSMNKDVHNRFVATYLAAEGIEIVKNIIDTDQAASTEGASGVFWNSTIQPGNTYAVEYDTTGKTIGQTNQYASEPLNFDSTKGLYSYTHGGTPSIFVRTIITKPYTGGSGVEVDSVVTWTVNGTTNSAQLDDTFTGWRQ